MSLAVLSERDFAQWAFLASLGTVRRRALLLPQPAPIPAQGTSFNDFASSATS